MFGCHVGRAAVCLAVVKFTGEQFARRLRAQFRMHDAENSFLAQCTKLGFVQTLGVSQVRRAVVLMQLASQG